MKYDKKLLAYSVVIGLLITLASSFFINNYVIGVFPDIQFVSIPIVGVAYYGHPLPWMRQVVYPGAEREIIWYHLIIDMIFWIALILLLKKSYFKGKKSKRIGRLKSRAKKKLKRKKSSRKKRKRKTTKRRSKKKSRRR